MEKWIKSDDYLSGIKKQIEQKLIDFDILKDLNLYSDYSSDLILYIADDIADAVNRHGAETIEFNIKLYSIDIPDKVREELSEEEINDIFWMESTDRIEIFGEYLKNKYDFIEEWYIEGRMGGWFCITPDLSDIQDNLIDIFNFYEEIEELEDDEYMQKYTEDILNLISRTNERIEYIRDSLIEIKQEVKDIVKNFEKDLESEDFWQKYIE